jgi:hypothetical protein
VTIAERFETALGQGNDPALEGPELLPVRLASAVARSLGVDGAGISLHDTASPRIPLGASSAAASVAERLQFTVGDGPCTAAQNTRMPVFAVPEELQRRWPAFAELLTTNTPYRAVVALPLQPALAGAGVIDLFFEDPSRVPGLDVFEAIAVGELVSSALSDAAVWSDWTPADGPAWMQGPAPRRRAAVWEAMGTVSVALEIEVPVALAMMRAHAYGQGGTVDDVASEVLAGRLRPQDLRPVTD